MSNTQNNSSQNPKGTVMPFSKKNYLLILIGIAILILGYALMSGGASESANEFNYEMFSWRRIVLAPIVLLVGFTAVGVAIFKRFKTDKDSKN